MTKDEARGSAWDSYAGQSIEFTVSTAFDAGFNAGYEYANKWNVIERDGLPPYDGDYLCVVRLPQECGNVWLRQRVLPCIENVLDENVIAWREIEPYRGE